jgi:hypothetical protein
MSPSASSPTLQRVSLTGADDQVPLRPLIELGEQYPFVEWALLYVPHAEGAPRNPSRAWFQNFFASQVPGYSAVHLCGRQAFEELVAGTLPRHLLQADRLQLNINARKKDFSDEEVLHVFQQALSLGPDVILQYHPDMAGVIEQFLATCSSEARARVHVLMDASRGTGLMPAQWTIPAALKESFVGFAGGLGPDVMEAALRKMEQCGQAYWADMESGLRSDNQFDVSKVRRVLEIAQAHLGAAADKRAAVQTTATK